MKTNQQRTTTLASVTDQLSGVLSSSTTRRQFMRLSAGVVGVGLLAACDTDDTEDADDSEDAEDTDEAADTTDDADEEESEDPAAESDDDEEAEDDEAETDDSADQAEELEELHIAVSVETRIMDPDLDQGPNTQYWLIYNNPVRTDWETGEPRPDLVESWEFEDDLTLVFSLREDVVWQDGEPLTADDFAFTWERMTDMERESPSTNVQRFDPWLDTVTARDEYTAEFKMSQPYAPVLDDLTGFWIFPRHDIEERGDEAYGQEPLGSGPYQVSEWEPGQYLLVEQNENWWGDPQPFQRVRVSTIVEGSTRASALLSGDVHISEDPPLGMLDQIDGSEDHYTTMEAGVRIQFIQFPSEAARREDTPEIEDKRVRQALNYALDVDTIAETVGRGVFTPVPGPWYGRSWAYPDNAEEIGYSYDPERARELLAEAGYEDGFTLYFGTSNGFSLMDAELMEACVPYFEDIGLTVEFISLEWASYDPARDNNEFSCYYLGLSGSPDPHGAMNFYMTSQGRERGFYGMDPEIDEIIWEGAEIVDFEERRQYYHEVLYPAVIDIAPWIYLWTPNNVWGVDNRIEYQATPDRSLDIMDVRYVG